MANIFDLAVQKLKQPVKRLDLGQNNDEGDDQANAGKEESTIVLYGSKNSGKTSMIMRFLDRDEPVKPTIALEYTYGRRAKANSKDIGHVWELGGGMSLLKLIDVPIKPQVVDSLAIMLFVDLSKPETLWTVLESGLSAVRQSVNKAMKALPEDARSSMLKQAWDRVGTDHVDKDLINPFPIPIAIVGAWYDTFQNLDPEQRKIICKTLRFMAHVNGATLLFYSLKIEALVTKGRAVMSQLLFGTSGSKTASVDHTKPIYVPAGHDSLKEIGAPSVSEDELRSSKSTSPIELWKSAFCTAFPQQEQKLLMQDDPAADSQFKEEAIDLLRAKKDQELQRYVKQRARDAALQQA